MGSAEMALMMKYGVPLIIRLVSKGKSEDEIKEVTTHALTCLNSDDISESLLAADDVQTANIIVALEGVLTGVHGSLNKLFKSLQNCIGDEDGTGN